MTDDIPLLLTSNVKSHVGVRLEYLDLTLLTATKAHGHVCISIVNIWWQIDPAILRRTPQQAYNLEHCVAEQSWAPTTISFWLIDLPSYE